MLSNIFHQVRRSLAKLSLPESAVRCKHVSSHVQRTHTCGELSLSHVGQEVKLCGWVQNLRMDQFLILRDSYGVTQVVISPSLAGEFGAESVVEVKGVVRPRPEGQSNQALSTGAIEVEAAEVKLLNACSHKLPFSVHEAHQVKEPLRMQQRYLDLRSARMQRRLRLRSRLIHRMRRYLVEEQGFVEVETPTLFRRTPGGAREFLVPTQTPGQFYSLPQSPQQFKQLLMVGGIDRYYQVARCYRDEGTRPDRQPEFTQLDVELSFVDSGGVMRLTEQVVTSSWPQECGPLPSTPFPHMSHHRAAALYGSDKPDTRFEWLLHDVASRLDGRAPRAISQAANVNDGGVRAFCVPAAMETLKRGDEAKLQLLAKQLGLPEGVSFIHVKEGGSWGWPLAKHCSRDFVDDVNACLGARTGDVIVLAAGPLPTVNKVLGRLRVDIADFLETKGVAVREKGFNFLWVLDFPLFEEGEDGLESAHHPFTAPHPEDIDLVYTDPLKVRGQHYDLVLNGQEVGGGSIRICDPHLQRYILEDILKEPSESLSHLLRALGSGCPPHGGIALGLDRLISILCGAPSIRDVIAFPKASDGRDLMSGSPTGVEEGDLDWYHIEVKRPDST